VWVTSANGFLLGKGWATALAAAIQEVAGLGITKPGITKPGDQPPWSLLGILDEACSVTNDAFWPGWLRLWSSVAGAFRLVVQLLVTGDTQQVLAGHTNPAGRPPHVIDVLSHTAKSWGACSQNVWREFPMQTTYRYQHWLQLHTINHNLYGGRMKLSVPKVDQSLDGRTDWVSRFRLRVFDSIGSTTHRVGTGRVNLAEAERVREYVVGLLYQHGVVPDDIAVIAMYSAQVGALKSMLKTFVGVEVATVDAFQGRERKHVAVSATSAPCQQTARASWTHAAKSGRANVALGRGQYSTALFVDIASLPEGHKGGLLRCVVSDMRSLGAVWSGPVVAAFEPNEEACKDLPNDEKMLAKLKPFASRTLQPAPPVYWPSQKPSHNQPLPAPPRAKPVPLFKPPEKVVSLDQNGATFDLITQALGVLQTFNVEPVGLPPRTKTAGDSVICAISDRSGTVVVTGTRRPPRGRNRKSTRQCTVVVRWTDDQSLVAFKQNQHLHLLQQTKPNPRPNS